jgi:hypothetical protein
MRDAKKVLLVALAGLAWVAFVERPSATRLGAAIASTLPLV